MANLKSLIVLSLLFMSYLLLGCDFRINFEGKQCPCIDGYKCCVSTKLCIKENETCCSGDGDCPGTGFICIKGSCVKGNCDKNADCLEGGQTCGGGGEPNVCGGVCKFGETRCDPLAPNSQMQTCGDNGQWGEATGCAVGKLCGASSLNSCGACSSDRQCIDASQYGEGFICVKGSCVKGNCHENADCPDGQICGGGGEPKVCGGVCKPGQTRCDPLAPTLQMQTCDDIGQWKQATECAVGKLCGASSPNSCGACTSDPQCVGASQYGEGFICVRGSCVEGNCHGDGECTVTGQTCGGGGNANFCGRPVCWSPTILPSAKSYIDIWTTALGRSGPGENCPQVGSSNTGSNPQYVWCRVWGDKVSNPANSNEYNHWWLWTDLDTGGKGWISAYYIKGQGNDQADDINTGKPIPSCE